MEFFVKRREFDPVVDAAALESVMNFAGPVGCDDDDGGMSGGECAELGDGDLPVGQELEEKTFKFLVGAVELVNEEDGRAVGMIFDGLKERSLEQKFFGKDILARRFFRTALGFEEADFQ